MRYSLTVFNLSAPSEYSIGFLSIKYIMPQINQIKIKTNTPDAQSRPDSKFADINLH